MVRIRPGLADSTTIRSAMKATSLMSWLTMRMEDGLRSAVVPDVQDLGPQALRGEGVHVS